MKRTCNGYLCEGPKYRFEDGRIWAMVKENDMLVVQPRENFKRHLYPESETQFFDKLYVDVQMTFVKDNNGKVTKLILHEAGHDRVAERI